PCRDSAGGLPRRRRPAAARRAHPHHPLARRPHRGAALRTRAAPAAPGGLELLRYAAAQAALERRRLIRLHPPPPAMSLQRIVLRDFVIVTSLDLELAGGFGVLTGETGAGKSILIDALQLALGA